VKSKKKKDNELKMIASLFRRRRETIVLVGSACLFIVLCGAAHATERPGGDSGGETPQVITLYEGLKRVTAEGHLVKIAGKDEAIAREEAAMAKSALLPRIDASGSRTALVTQPASVYRGETVPGADRNYFSYSISVRQLLFDFSGTLSKYRAGRSLYEARRLNTESVRNRLALEFTIGYFNVLEADKLIETAGREVERLTSHLNDARKMYEAGVITKNDLLQAQVRLTDARQKLLSVKNLRDLRAARLNHLLLLPIDGPFEAAEYDREIGDPASMNFEAIWKETLAGRPEIGIADKTIEAVEFEAVAGKSEFLPKMFVAGANEYVQNSYLRHEDNWSLVVGVDVNLFAGGYSRADLRKTEYRKQKLVEQRATLIDEIGLELRQYCLDMRNAYERILVNRDAVGQALENLRINRSRYEAGVGTATEVLDAVTLLTAAETNHIRSVYDFRKAEAAVFYASGKDFLKIYGK
jgi:outer membrane protein